MRTLEQLGQELSTVYEKALKKEKLLSVMLFCIEHGEDIQKVGIKETIQEAKLPNGYIPEVCKSIRLSKYVKIK